MNRPIRTDQLSPAAPTVPSPRLSHATGPAAGESHRVPERVRRLRFIQRFEAKLRREQDDDADLSCLLRPQGM